MTRIIGGAAGGRRLRTPAGDRTRPTSDRVREALFSTLESECGSIAGLRFLDLYAGTGAIGLEAMSRGAGLATLVEHERRASELIRDNARTLGFKNADVVQSSVPRYLAHAPRAPYDLVFSDPPYPRSAQEVVDDLTLLVDGGWLCPGALVVVERSTRTEDVAWPDGLVGHRSKRYGETTLWYGHAGKQKPE